MKNYYRVILGKGSMHAADRIANNEISALEQKREKTRLLKQGMMQELLTGMVRLV